MKAETLQRIGRVAGYAAIAASLYRFAEHPGPPITEPQIPLVRIAEHIIYRANHPQTPYDAAGLLIGATLVRLGREQKPKNNTTS